MQFRCPNCRLPIQVEDAAPDHLTTPMDEIECPSCHSYFSLSGEPDETVVPAPNKNIQHFELKSILGEGAFGRVYKAWDPELKRFVALKVPRSLLHGHSTARAFLREARAAASLSHPNVVSVLEIGAFEGGYYIATQLIEGISFSEYLKLHSMPPKEAAQLLIKVLRAIQFFHEKGIVHRDLKPGNILLDANNEPYVSDFGLAIRDEPNEVTITRTGNIAGTLNYMSPEQARGERNQLDGRSDVYAVGIILYEVLTGLRPFSATSSQTILHRILSEDPKPPGKHNPSVPPELEAICLKAIEKSPDRRFATAAEMADDLQRFLDNRPIVAKPPGLQRRFAKWVSRNRAAAAAGVISLVSAVAGSAFILIPPLSLPENAVVALISTDPAADVIEFELHDPDFKIPHRSAFKATTTSSHPVVLQPGLYKVRAHTSQGHYHEVWRTVPEPGTPLPAEDRFPHLSFFWEPDLQLILPSFSLFKDDDIQDPLARVSGGTFEMGYQKPGDLAGRHQHPVDSFMAGINEVSWGRFREVMSKPLGNPANGRTYLTTFAFQYGDKADIPDDQPVTGYPVDVAILYCELSGTRLPANFEYEYAATQRGSSKFPTGDTAAVADVGSWKILNTQEPTPDTSPEGIRNLYFSVAEFTDNVAVSYKLLYSDLLPQLKEHSLPAEFKSTFGQVQEVRGAPPVWITPDDTSDALNVRQRIALPIIPQQSAATDTTFDRVGWRVYRSIHNQTP